MEYAQKESLLDEINELEENAVNGVIEIIKVAESIVDDAEIDLGELQSSTMWKVRCWLPFTRPAMRMHARCLLPARLTLTVRYCYRTQLRLFVDQLKAAKAAGGGR